VELGGTSRRILGAEDGEVPPGRARAHLELGKQRLAPERASALLAEFSAMLAGAPAAFRAAGGDPCGRLERQRAALAARLESGEALEEADIGGLRELYHDTLSAFLAATRARREWREALHARIEAAMDAVLFAEQMALLFSAELAGHAVELATLRARLLGLCGADEPDAETLGVVERRIETLRGEIDRESMTAAQRRGAAEAVTRILGEMGYESIDDFAFERDTPMAVASMRIPGGEIVRAALHQNRRLAFEVVHERPLGADADAPMTTSECIRLQRQEKKWCADMREMFRRLVAEGFQYRVAFEHELNQDAVKVVVVESAADVLDSGVEVDAELRQQLRMNN